ncbi:MAG: type II secretion system protein [Bryobacterales bacterium]|nr:type II secretion system protein [Bryobacterales bacterium]
MRREGGVTLIEMLIVITIISVMVGITFPAVTSGVDSLRLVSAADSTATFLNSAMNRADRRQRVMEITLSKSENKVTARSSEAGYERTLTMPAGVKITAVKPDIPHIYLYPGGAIPRLYVELTNARGARKTVSVDPITGVPEIQTPGEEEEK